MFRLGQKEISETIYLLKLVDTLHFYVLLGSMLYTIYLKLTRKVFKNYLSALERDNY